MLSQCPVETTKNVFPHLRVNKVVILTAVTELLASFEKASSANLGHIK